MVTRHKVQIYDTSEQLSKAACNLIIETAKESIAEKGRFSLVLSGGHTPETLFSLMAEPYFSKQIQWEHTFIFWGDERCVPLTDLQNNAYKAELLLLDKIDIPAVNIFPIPVNLEPTEAAKKYEETLKDFFGDSKPAFDLVLLGLGTNGHTASLFPGTSVIHESTRWVKEVYIDELKMFRVTMTVPLINQAHNVIFLVSGSEKADIIKRVLDGTNLPEKYPAQLINPVKGKLFWYLDKDAANKIEH